MQKENCYKQSRNIKTIQPTKHGGAPSATGGEGACGGELADASFLFGYFLWTSKENSHGGIQRVAS